MPTVAVLDMAGKEVGKMDLSEAVFGIEPNKKVMHDVGSQPPCKPAPGYAVRENACGSFRRRQKAVETERNGPR
jgi:ribosomal protein L4